MKKMLKSMLFGSGLKPRAIWTGPAAGVKLHIDPIDKAQRILGLDEREILAAFRRLAAGAGGFIDVGASDGYYCVLARRFNPKLHTIGCEGQARFQAEAEANFALNFGPNPEGMAWRVGLVGPAAGQQPLDAVAEGLPRPVFVKIDVDGYEIDVLESGRRLLAEPGTRLLIETHSAELEAGCIKLLEGLGYHCAIIKNAWWRSLVPERRVIELNRWLVAERAS